MQKSEKMEKKSIRELKAEAHNLKPVVRVGKNGLTDDIIMEIKKQLKKRKLIKVKFLKSAIGDKNKRELAEELARRTGSELVSMIGFVASLYKSKSYNHGTKGS